MPDTGIGSGVAFELSVVNKAAVISNIYAVDREIRAAAKRTVLEVSRFVHAETFRRAAFDTGFMRDHIRTRITEGGYGYEVGWDATDFFSSGKAFYPFFVEFGTVHMAAQPALIPAGREGDALMRVRMAAAIRAAIARRSIR